MHEVNLMTNYPPLETDQNLVSSRDIFAAIIEGSLEASVVYRDEHVIALLDIQPVNQGHVLVMPITPARFLYELDDQVAVRLFVVARKISLAIRNSGIPCTGINLFLADGASAGQEVPHVHLHVFPRYEGDGFGLTFPPRYFEALPSRAELKTVASTLSKALDDITDDHS
jgi:histidine triad (HIT) family protein